MEINNISIMVIAQWIVYAIMTVMAIYAVRYMQALKNQMDSMIHSIHHMSSNGAPSVEDILEEAHNILNCYDAESDKSKFVKIEWIAACQVKAMKILHESSYALGWKMIHLCAMIHGINSITHRIEKYASRAVAIDKIKANIKDIAAWNSDIADINIAESTAMTIVEYARPIFDAAKDDINPNIRGIAVSGLKQICIYEDWRLHFGARYPEL